MWVSNTATAIMMLPIALSVIALGSGEDEDHGGAEISPSPLQRNFALCMLLGIAYGASLGGIGTLIGTPPNLFLASFAQEHLGREISFVRWMGVGLPLVAVFLPVVWLLLTRVLYPLGHARLESAATMREASRQLGPMKRGEWVTLAVFTLTALAWIFRPLLSKVEVGGLRPLAGLTDPGIARFGGARTVHPTGGSKPARLHDGLEDGSQASLGTLDPLWGWTEPRLRPARERCG